jgi:hypothetical protein
MGIIIVLAFTTSAAIIAFTAMYMLQFYVDLNGDNAKRIKDGLVKELIIKAVKHTDPDSYVVNKDAETILMHRFIIESSYEQMFWFPYIVKKLPLDFRQRQTEDDWGGTVGYVTRFSKDYFYIKAILKKSKTNIEQTQRQKLNLNK